MMMRVKQPNSDVVTIRSMEPKHAMVADKHSVTIIIFVSNVTVRTNPTVVTASPTLVKHVMMAIPTILTNVPTPVNLPIVVMVSPKIQMDKVIMNDVTMAISMIPIPVRPCVWKPTVVMVLPKILMRLDRKKNAMTVMV